MSELFRAIHPVHGECWCDDHAFFHRVENDPRWQKKDGNQENDRRVADVPIEEVVSMRRIVNSLRHHGIHTGRQLLDASDADLIPVWGINEENLAEYRERAKAVIRAD